MRIATHLVRGCTGLRGQENLESLAWETRQGSNLG
jgi:hypothetical protein